MEPVLGNGVASEIGCWMEACVARSTIANAGEMNGFLQAARRASAAARWPRIAAPWCSNQGSRRELDDDAVSRVAVGVETFSARRAQAHA